MGVPCPAAQQATGGEARLTSPAASRRLAALKSLLVHLCPAQSAARQHLEPWGVLIFCMRKTEAEW